MRIPIVKAQKRLAIVWLAGSGILFILLLLQTIFGRYGDKVDEAWAWLLPTFMPVLSLIIGVLIADNLGEGSENKTVDRFLLRLSLLLSIMYLIVVSLTILMSPFSEFTPLELMRISNLWLAPFQGLVAAAIGAFFVNRRQN